MRSLALLALFVTFLGCKGDTGPAGPQGPQGLPGPNITHDQHPCPTGMIRIGAACMDAAENPAPTGLNFVSASSECFRAGKRLCTFAEWQVACRDFQAQIMKLTDNREWVDEIEYTDGGVMGIAVGNGGCNAVEQLPIDTSPGVFFHCCL